MKTYKKYLNGDTKQAKNSVYQIGKVLDKIKKTNDYKNL